MLQKLTSALLQHEVCLHTIEDPCLTAKALAQKQCERTRENQKEAEAASLQTNESSTAGLAFFFLFLRDHQEPLLSRLGDNAIENTMAYTQKTI